jgi:hypothetical protein
MNCLSQLLIIIIAMKKGQTENRIVVSAVLVRKRRPMFNGVPMIVAEAVTSHCKERYEFWDTISLMLNINL